MILFSDRLQAGDFLAKKLLPLRPQLKDPIVLGIPRGGIPVGYRVAKSLASPLDTIVLRKTAHTRKSRSWFWSSDTG